MVIHPTRATTTREEARRLLRTIDAARGHLAAALRDPHASEERIAEAVRRARGAAHVLQSDRRDRTSEEGRYGHE